MKNRSISLVALTGGVRNLKSKRDIRQLQFDKEQVHIYNKIRGARSTLDNYSRQENRVPSENVRKLKAIQLDEERKQKIEKENRRLLESMAKIVEGGY